MVMVARVSEGAKLPVIWLAYLHKCKTVHLSMVAETRWKFRNYSLETRLLNFSIYYSHSHIHVYINKCFYIVCVCVFYSQRADNSRKRANKTIDAYYIGKSAMAIHRNILLLWRGDRSIFFHFFHYFFFFK